MEDIGTDPVEEALGQMQQQVQKEMERSFKEMDKANRAKHRVSHTGTQSISSTILGLIIPGVKCYCATPFLGNH